MTHNPTEQTMEAHERRARMVDALNHSLAIFASHSEKEFGDVMANGLRPWAKAMNVNRIVIYRLIEADEKRRLRQIYRWDAAQGGLTDESVSILPDIPMVTKWMDIVMQDVCINKQLCDMSEDEVAFMDTFGIKSILAVPVFMHDDFWGCIVFQDHVNERHFAEDCMDLVRSAARLCVYAIVREETVLHADGVLKTLKHSKNMTDTLSKMAIAFLSQSEKSFEDMMTMGAGLIVDTIHIDRLSIWRNFTTPDGLHASRIYCWDRELGAAATPAAGTEDGAHVRLAPQWEKIFAGGESFNGPIRALPEAALLQSLGTVSAFVAPLLIEHAFWGFALYEDRHTERYFDPDSTDMMRSAAFLFANAAISAEMEHEIADKNELNRAMFNAAPIGLTVFDDNLQLTDCNETILNMYGGITEQYYLDNFFNLSPEYQPDGSKSSDKVREIIRHALKGEKKVMEWTQRSPSGELIPCELTLTRTKYRGKYFVLSYIYDLRHIKSMEKNIQRLELEVDKIYYDALTGIYNRRYFDENLKSIMKSMSRSGSRLSLMMIDIDYFKKYNDTYGHSAGDKCLKTIAQVLSQSIMRAGDFIARYGGEEFAVVLPNVDENGACMVAEKLLENIRNCKIPHEKSDVASCVTISIGITSGPVQHRHREDDYIKRADEMLYKSKQNGRNRYNFANL